jgi:hypothetical protein
LAVFVFVNELHLEAARFLPMPVSLDTEMQRTTVRSNQRPLSDENLP